MNASAHCATACRSALPCQALAVMMSIAGCSIDRADPLPKEAFSTAFSVEEQSAVSEALRDIVIGAEIAAVRSAVWTLLQTIDENLEAVRRPVPLLHVATTAVSGTSTTIAAATLCREEETYFVFEHDRLAEIRTLPRWPALNDVDSIRQHGDSYSMADFEERLIACLSRMEQSEEWAAQYREPPPFLFLFSDDSDDDYREQLALLERFDGFFIDLGMTSEEVRNRLGEPDHTMVVEDEPVDRFEPSGPSGRYAPRIAVHYRDDRVIKVLSSYVIAWR